MTTAERRPLATPVQIAEYLEIPEPTLRQWRHKGTGPQWTRVGRHVRYRWSDVEAWLDSQTGQSRDTR